MVCNLIIIDSTPSTNTLMAREFTDAAHGTVLMATAQTAGRGQRGNSWESEPGKNVSMSVMLRPHNIAAAQQFCISEAVALAVAQTLDSRLAPANTATIKWPNDIYVGDKKIAGILIENSLSGTHIDRCIAGIGININQQHFLSDAPNPTSLIHYTGEATDTVAFAKEVADRILAFMDELEQDNTSLHEQYMSKLWRRQGLYPYRDAASGEIFQASIDDIAPSGHIALLDSGGRRRIYAFKEVAALIS